MSICPDHWICDQAKKGMIVPFEERQVRQLPLQADRHIPHDSFAKIISYGVTSYGYDMRCSDHWKIFTPHVGGEVDPKRFNEDHLIEAPVHLNKADQTRYVVLPPHSYGLSSSVERFKIPRNVMTVCIGKSTYARCGIIANVTPLEPEWEGHLTIEVANTTPLPARIYVDEGIAQILFFEGMSPPETSYADRKGKYQNQEARPVPAKV